MKQLFNEGTLPIVIILATIVSVIMAVRYRDLIWPAEPARSSRPGRVTARPGVRPGRAARSPGRAARSPVQNGAGGRSEQQDAESASVQRSAFSVQRSDEPAPAPAPLDLPATVDELQMLAEAIRLKASGEATRKQDAIERAFQVTKGAGAGWRRASELYDLAVKRAPADRVTTA